MAANTVLNYLPRESVVHRLTGTTKLAFFLLFTFASMITYNTWVLLGLLAVSISAFKLSKIRFKEVRFMMIFMLVFLLLNNLFIFLFDPDQGTTLYGTRHVLCHLFWRYDLTAEQLFYMVNISIKYFVALPVAILFISATNPSEFAASLNRIDTISNAMELRGFGKHKKRTWYTKRSFARNDFIVLGLGVVLLGVSLTVTILYGRFYNPFV